MDDIRQKEPCLSLCAEIAIAECLREISTHVGDIERWDPYLSLCTVECLRWIWAHMDDIG